MKTLADKLREREKALGLTQAQAASAAGLSAKRYSHYVTGRSRPNYENLLKISRVLKTSPNFLLGFEATNQAKFIDQLIAVAGTLDDAQIRALISIADGFHRDL